MPIEPASCVQDLGFLRPQLLGARQAIRVAAKALAIRLMNLV